MRKAEGEKIYLEVEFLSADITRYEDQVPCPGLYHYRVKSANKAGYSLSSNIAEAVVKG